MLPRHFALRCLTGMPVRLDDVETLQANYLRRADAEVVRAAQAAVLRAT